jgi:ribosome-binding factor A
VPIDRRFRIADLIKHEIAKLLLEKSRDPRFVFVSVVSVEVSKDYSHAKVFVTVLEDQDKDAVLKALNKAASFFKYQLAHTLNMRTTPDLCFYYDDTFRQSQRISELLKK